MPPRIDQCGRIGRIGHHLYQRHRLAYQLVPFVSEEFEGRVARTHDHRHTFGLDLQLKYAVPGLLEEGSKPLLALAHGRLGLLALGDVADHSDEKPLSGWIDVAGLARDDRAHLSAGQIAQGFLVHIFLARIEHTGVHLPEDRDLVRGEHVITILTKQAFSWTADDCAQSVVDQHKTSLVILHEDRVRDRVDDPVEEGCRQTQLVFGPFALGDVLLDRDEMRDVALAIEDGGDGGRLPVKLPVLLAVAEFAVPGASRVDGGPQLLVFGRCGHSRLEDSRILSQSLSDFVTSQLQKPGVDVFDLALPIGDDDACRTLLHRHGEAP